MHDAEVRALLRRRIAHHRREARMSFRLYQRGEPEADANGLTPYDPIEEYEAYRAHEAIVSELRHLLALIVAQARGETSVVS